MSEFRVVPTRGLGATLATVGLLALNQLPTAQPDIVGEAHAIAAKAVHAAELYRDRDAMARRYGSCVITKVLHDTHTVRSSDGSARQELEVGLELVQTDASRQARQLPENDEFGWQVPKAFGYVLSNGSLVRTTNIKPGGAGFSEFDSRNEHPTIPLEPRIYPNGAEAAVYVRSEAYTGTAAGEVVQANEILCGTLKVQHGVWTPEQPLGAPAGEGTGPQLPNYDSIEFNPYTQ